MRKNKIDQFAWQNMSEDEQKSYQETFKQYKGFRSELLKKNKELERSKHDLDFWYKEQKCAKAMEKASGLKMGEMDEKAR